MADCYSKKEDAADVDVEDYDVDEDEEGWKRFVRNPSCKKIKLRKFIVVCAKMMALSACSLKQKIGGRFLLYFCRGVRLLLIWIDERERGIKIHPLIEEALVILPKKTPRVFQCV